MKNETIGGEVSRFFKGLLSNFVFRDDLLLHASILSESVPNLVTLIELGGFSSLSENEISIASTTEKPDGHSNDINFENAKFDKTSCETVDERYEGKFVSPNVVNVSGRKLSSAEIYLLSKG